MQYYFLFRESIRKTWGKYSVTDMREKTTRNEDLFFSEVLFILGSPKDDSNGVQKQQMAIEKESRISRDILQVNIEESYHNCFYKGTVPVKQNLNDIYKLRL